MVLGLKPVQALPNSVHLGCPRSYRCFIREHMGLYIIIYYVSPLKAGPSGVEAGSKAYALPTDAELIAMARTTLGMQTP